MWHVCHGAWWMVQWQFDGWASLGVHLDLKRRYTAREGIAFGPYIDLHLGCFIVSLGVNPRFSQDLDSPRLLRGGVRASEH